jgi:DNA-binding NarL/FixJ family response regulator
LHAKIAKVTFLALPLLGGVSGGTYIMRVLLVEPDGTLRARLRECARPFAQVDGDAEFPRARTRLLSLAYDWVITNVRLDEYNGLHLMHLAAVAKLRARVLVYADRRDVALAREAQRAGAIFETRAGVQRAIRACLNGLLPARDRRNAEGVDRRTNIRGGRRSTDHVSPT